MQAPPCRGPPHAPLPPPVVPRTLTRQLDGLSSRAVQAASASNPRNIFEAVPDRASRASGVGEGTDLVEDALDLRAGLPGALELRYVEGPEVERSDEVILCQKAGWGGNDGRAGERQRLVPKRGSGDRSSAQPPRAGLPPPLRASLHLEGENNIHSLCRAS